MNEWMNEWMNDRGILGGPEWSFGCRCCCVHTSQPASRSSTPGCTTSCMQPRHTPLHPSTPPQEPPPRKHLEGEGAAVVDVQLACRCTLPIQSDHQSERVPGHLWCGVVWRQRGGTAGWLGGREVRHERQPDEIWSTVAQAQLLGRVSHAAPQHHAPATRLPATTPRLPASPAAHLSGGAAGALLEGQHGPAAKVRPNVLHGDRGAAEGVDWGGVRGRGSGLGRGRGQGRCRRNARCLHRAALQAPIHPGPAGPHPPPPQTRLKLRLASRAASTVVPSRWSYHRPLPGSTTGTSVMSLSSTGATSSEGPAA